MLGGQAAPLLLALVALHAFVQRWAWAMGHAAVATAAMRVVGQDLTWRFMEEAGFVVSNTESDTAHKPCVVMP